MHLYKNILLFLAMMMINIMINNFKNNIQLNTNVFKEKKKYENTIYYECRLELD